LSRSMTFSSTVFEKALARVEHLLVDLRLEFV
jgi:hypothetical protein